MNKIPIEYVRTIVDSKPKSKRFIFWDKVSVVILIIIIFFPMIILPIIGALLNLDYIYLFCASCYLLMIPFGIWNRGRVYREFFRIKHGEKYFKIVNLEAESHLKELEKKSALTCIGEPTDEWLNFIYNWLYFFNAIEKGKIVTIYTYKGSLIKNAFNEERLSDNEPLFTIEPNDYNPPEEEKTNFYRTHFDVGCRYLDDIINNLKQ